MYPFYWIVNNLMISWLLMVILTKGPFGWRGENVGGWKMMEEWKSERIKKILIYLLFVWLGVEKWKYRKSEFI